MQSNKFHCSTLNTYFCETNCIFIQSACAKTMLRNERQRTVKVCIVPNHWYFLVLPDILWYSLLLPGTLWQSLVFSGTLCYSMVLSDTLGYSLVHLSTPCWHSLVFSESATIWYFLALSGTLCYFLVLCGTPSHCAEIMTGVLGERSHPLTMHLRKIWASQS